MLKNRFKGCTNTIAGVLYFVHCHRENTGPTESHRVLSEVQKGSQKEIQAVALNKTGTQCIYQCFPPELGGGGGRHTLGITQPKQSHCPREFDRRLWHRGCTLDVSARKLMKLCLHMGRELNCLIPSGNSAFVCLFVLRLYVPVNNFSVMSGRSHRFLGN